MDAENEVERQAWHPNVVRMRMIGYSDANLEAMTRNDHARQVERDVAAAILADRKAFGTAHAHEIEDIKKHRAVLEQQASEREAAKGFSELVEESVDAVRRAEATPNEMAAYAFTKRLIAAGLRCQPMRTTAIANRGPVKDGWVVNYHDQDLEIGLVATWWGRNHFQAYIEVAGHADRSDETAAMFAELFTRAQGPGT